MIGEFQPPSILDAAGPFSHHIEKLWWGYFIVLMSVFGVVMIVLLFALLKPRPRTGSGLQFECHNGTPGAEYRIRIRSHYHNRIVCFSCQQRDNGQSHRNRG